MKERIFQSGDLIRIFESKSGNPIRQYKYVENKGWKLIK